MAILAGKRTVLVRGPSICECSDCKAAQHFRLLIRGGVELFGQFGRTLGGIGRTVMPPTVLLHGRGLLLLAS